MRALALLLSMLIVTGAAAGPAPEQLVRQQADVLLERMPMEVAGQALEDVVEEIIAPHVDFDLFSRLVLGKHWRALSAAQKTRFTDGMMHMVIKTYSAALASASALQIEYLETRKEGKSSRVVVPTIVSSAGQAPVRVDYKLYEKDQVWKVYDVAIEGISMAINYRSVFAERIGAEGIDAVIEGLRKQPDALAAQ